MEAFIELMQIHLDNSQLVSDKKYSQALSDCLDTLYQ